MIDHRINRIATQEKYRNFAENFYHEGVNNETCCDYGCGMVKGQGIGSWSEAMSELGDLWYEPPSVEERISKDAQLERVARLRSFAETVAQLSDDKLMRTMATQILDETIGSPAPDTAEAVRAVAAATAAEAMRAKCEDIARGRAKSDTEYAYEDWHRGYNAAALGVARDIAALKTP
jgi:hypothetical protein